MTFHPKKYEVLWIGAEQPDYSYQMFPDGPPVQLNTVESVKDLGVHIDKQLSFDNHCNEATKKANKILAIIRRTFMNIDSTNMLKSVL